MPDEVSAGRALFSGGARALPLFRQGMLNPDELKRQRQ
jgi:hypothetical protein